MVSSIGCRCTVNGFLAPKATPNAKPGDEVHGDPALAGTFGKRAPGSEAIPLLTPADVSPVAGQTDEVSLFQLLESRAASETDFDIDITPTPEQLQTWKVGDTPVGATGKWYEFGKTPGVWKMRGLSGCTGIIILSSKGFWAGHLWENTNENVINGGSAFLKRTSHDNSEERTLDEFKKVAVDIMTEATPANQARNRQHWISLKDLETQKGNPFGSGDDVNVFLLTRAVSATNTAQRYSKQISALGRALKAAVNPGRGQLSAWTYPGAGDSDKLDLKNTNGKIIIEYTPFHGVNPDDNCKHIAAAQVLVNPVKQKAPVIKKTWVATDNQHAKRDASCNKPSGPKPSCYQQNQDPDQGITTEYCVCDKSRTLPFLTISPTVVRTKSCEYTSLPPKDTKRDVAFAAAVAARTAMATTSPTPASPVTVRGAPAVTGSPALAGRDLTITKDLGPPTTDRKHCQVCTRVVNNEDSCSSMRDCVVQTGAVTLEAGSSSVHVGTVTGTALYTGVSSALEKICPTPTKGGFTACKTDSAAIGKVPYVEGGFLATDGEIVVSVESSKYNDTKIRGALIKTAAAAAQKAAAGKNCYEARYDVEELKRRRGWWDPSRLVARLLGGRDHPHPEQEKATWCNSVGFAGPHYYNPWWKLQSQPGATDYMDVHFEFHKGGGGDFDCEFLQGLVDAFAFVAPEFAVGDVGLGEAVKVLCDCASGESCGLRRRELDNSTLVGM
ncbi:hypothetical protein PG999_004109 [Apiospora kogelbergensis]|uniref:Uncharacterized protein n=1 Tax=Apiospora kogelbergensis TaxID=1337665 RepID=A0AAW0R5J3_9PEZI